MANKTKWRRYRFSTKSVNDYRPLIFNANYPWWCSGETESSTTIIAWLPETECLLKYWDDAEHAEFTEHNVIEFTVRFPKPDWYEEN